VQKESCILQVPCVTVRNNTERPESVAVGANILAGKDPQELYKSVMKMMVVEEKWENPFGDGKSAQRIVDIIEESFACVE